MTIFLYLWEFSHLYKISKEDTTKSCSILGYDSAEQKIEVNEEYSTKYTNHLILSTLSKSNGQMGRCSAVISLYNKNNN